MLIRGGTVVLESGPTQLDLRTQGEKITERGANLSAAPGETVIDASNLLVLPGCIDSHVHFREPGDTQKEDFLTGTRSALAGGVTTILDMPNTQPPTDSREHLHEKAALAAAKAVVDYGLYLGATDTNHDEAAALAGGVAALKLYMGSSTGNLLVTDFAPLYRHFATFPRHKPLVVHAEDEPALRYFSAQGAPDHNQGRPPLCAQLAVGRALTLAEHLGRALHIAHVTTHGELALIREARARGVRVTCEVTPLHLFLTEEDARRLGNYGKVNPPLRSLQDQQMLWANLDVIDTIATDHAPHTRAEKEQEYARAPAGIPGVETMLPLLLTAASQGKCSLRDIVTHCVVNPARLFGLQTKGALEPGKDADVVLVDPNEEYMLQAEQLSTKCGWSPFAGWTLKGRICQVYLRGHLAYHRGAFLTDPGTGQMLQPG